jgi:hypothetical protein
MTAMSNQRRSAVEMSDTEIMEEVSKMFNRSKFVTENSYEVSCRQCDKTIILDEQQHRHYENNNLNGYGFTIPKCAECWGIA